LASKKFYAVRRGKKPGIYTSWPECQKQVAGFANARFKGFMTREEALAWLQQPEKSKPRAVKHATQTSLDLFGENRAPDLFRRLFFIRMAVHAIAAIDGAITFTKMISQPGPI
jgi:ribonuclease HI